MKPSILIDKSVLECLSDDEVKVLHEFFTVVIPPVLVLELQTDMVQTERRKGKAGITQLAERLCHPNARPNSSFAEMLVLCLLGQEIPMKQQPIRIDGKAMTTSDGRPFIYSDEDQGSSRLRRWISKDFSEGDTSWAKERRNLITEIDLEPLIRNFRRDMTGVLGKSDLTDSASLLAQSIQKDDPAWGLRHLKTCLEMVTVDQDLQTKIHNRWLNNGMPNLHKFAPYAYYCYWVYATFLTGVSLSLLGTRRTNLIDVEYVFYLPFCMVFSSGDKFHEQFAPVFLNDDQKFVKSQELKNDLSSILEILRGIPNGTVSGCRMNRETIIAALPKSNTIKLWLKYRKTITNDTSPTKTSKSDEEVISFMKPFIESIKKHDRESKDDDSLSE